MRLDSITLQNFRCFEHLHIDLHPELTVLVAQNGGGKTTVLDALRIAVWPYVRGFDLGSQTGKSATIQIDDVRLKVMPNGNMEQQLPSEIGACGNWSIYWGEVQSWTQSRESVKKRTNTKADSIAVRFLDKHAKQLQKNIREGGATQIDLPLIVYLGTGRLWYQSRYSSIASEANLDKTDYSRLSGYLDCLTQSSSFKQFKDWFGWIYRSYREEQILAIESGQVLDDQTSQFANAILVVQQATNALLTAQTGWRDISYSAKYHQQLVLTHPDHGTLPLELLSDGLRNMVAMVADIAFRCIKLNPHFGREAAHQTQGIVMIDEVDMFLHPQWQQTVVHSLRQAFPKIQFIVTTHSPQLLSTVPAECIRGLKIENGQIIVKTYDFSEGAEAKDMLEDILGVTSRAESLKIVKHLNEYMDLVYSDRWDSDRAIELRVELDQWGKNKDPILTKLDMDIRMRQYRRNNG